MIQDWLSLFLALLPSLVSAKRVQILHLNDLHSFFAGTRTGKGGYAKLKTKIMELRSKAKSLGMRTLHLDAGDFGEGSVFFSLMKGSTL